MNYSMIDLIALGGKLGIESASVNRWAKEGLKTAVDCGAANAKEQLFRQQYLSVMGLPLSFVNSDLSN